MRPLTARRPKVMLPVGGRPILEHLLMRAAEAGFDDFLILTHYHAEAVRKHFGNGKAWGVKVAYADQATAGGTGHAVARLKGHVKGPFTLVYGDAMFSAKDLAQFRKGKGLAVAAKQVEDARPYGLLTVKKGTLAGLEEKPATLRSGWVNAGAYRLDDEVIRACAELGASPRGELELTDAIAARAKGEKVHVLPTPSWRDVGRPWDLLEAQAELLATMKTRIQGKVDPSVVLEGPVIVEKGAHVRHHTVIEGPCLIQAGARVGPNAYLRGSTVIGPGCHVGAGVEIKNSLLMERTNVPHLSYVGDSVLGAGCNLGAGTQVANLKHSSRNVRVQLEDGAWVDTGRRKFGVILGDDVKTGINSTLNVGSVLGPGARVLPGRIVEGYVPPGAWVA